MLEFPQGHKVGSEVGRVFHKRVSVFYWVENGDPKDENYYYYLLKAYSSVNRTRSPQGFLPNRILQELNTIQNMHILQT